MALALYRCPGVYDIAILVDHNKFRSADLLVSGDICLADMHLRGFINHHYGLYLTIFAYGKDDLAGDHISFWCLFLAQRVGLACDQNTFDDMALALYRCPGVYYIAILVYDHKFRSADLLVSGDVCLADMHLRGVIYHHYGLH